MGKPMLRIVDKDGIVEIRTQCCIDHAWVTTSMCIQIAEDEAVICLQIAELNTMNLSAVDAALFAGHLRFLGAIAEAINQQVTDKTGKNIQQVFSTQFEQQETSCPETLVLH